MPDRDITERVSDALETLEEYTGINVPKASTKIAASAYTQAALVAAMTFPLLVGGPPALSQEQTRRADEHLASQNQHGNATLEGAALEASTNTTGRTFYVRVSGALLMPGELST